MPVALQIADTVLEHHAWVGLSSPSKHECSEASVLRSEGVFPAETGTVRRKIFKSFNQFAISQRILVKHTLFSQPLKRNSSSVYCLANGPRAVCSPSPQRNPMPEEANGNQARQY